MIIFLSVICILCFFTMRAAHQVFRTDWQLPKTVDANLDQQRLVLITQEMDTPFWNEVVTGATNEAKKEQVSIEVWGSYGNNKEEFLKSMEIAIQSKVDGIIVQGLDTTDFKNLAKIKASFYGIPIITIANDVPMEDSLRRSYVGSDQLLAGKSIAEQLVRDMGERGKVVLMLDAEQEYYQKQRLEGIENILKQYKDIEVLYGHTVDTTKDEVIKTTREILNLQPDVDAFIAVNAHVVGTLIEEISKRYQIEPYYIYSFDDGPDSVRLLQERTLDAMVVQAPEEMGEKSVQLMMEWLHNEEVPLDKNGYLTDIKVQEAENKNE